MTKPLSRVLLLALALATVSPGLHAQTRDATSPPSGTLETPVVNLPDFTRLVEAVSPAVVNIEATSGGRENQDEDTARRGAEPMPEDMPEFFRRFFGQPGMPGIPDRMPRGGTSQGSGFIITSDGYVLTNHHVVQGADRILVRLSDRNELEAELVGSDPLSDVALLKVKGKGLPVLRTGDSRNLKAGQWVLAIGSPFSNSGGYMGVSFAIPIEVAMNAVRQLRETGKVTRGQLGVRIQDVDRERLAELGLDRPTGAFVDSVENGSAADKAGIRPGDVIIRFNGREVPRSASLPPMVGALPPGSRATVTVMREGKARDLVVTLSALEMAAAAAPAGEGRPATPEAAANPLGLEVEALDAAARSAMGLGAGEGVLVSRVTGLAARQAGLAPGDVILRVGQDEVGSVAEFEAAAEGLEAGDEVRLLVRNARSTGFVSFVLR